MASGTADEEFPAVTGRWIPSSRTNVLGTYYKYVLEGSSQTEEFLLPHGSDHLDDEIRKIEAELLMLASWNVFLRNAKLTGRGKNP
jgi:hypothetical protein